MKVHRTRGSGVSVLCTDGDLLIASIRKTYPPPCLYRTATARTVLKSQGLLFQCFLARAWTFSSVVTAPLSRRQKSCASSY